MSKTLASKGSLVRHGLRRHTEKPLRCPPVFWNDGCPCGLTIEVSRVFLSEVLSVEIKQVLSIVLLIAVISGCSSVISNSEDFYKKLPREPISDSLLFRLHCCGD